jgi:hypothetical protein
LTASGTAIVCNCGSCWRNGRVGAVGDEGIGLPRSDQHAVDVAVAWWRRRVRPAGQLQRLRLQTLRAAGRRGSAALDALEHLEGVVACRVGLGRRRGQLHVVVEQALRQRFALQLEAGRGQQTQRIAREGLHALGLAGLGERARLLHVGRREDVGAFAALQAVAQQTGGTEHEFDLASLRRRFEVLADLRQRGAQAAGGVDGHCPWLRLCRVWHAQQGCGCRQRRRHGIAALHRVRAAFGKNSCSPSIL